MKLSEEKVRVRVLDLFGKEREYLMVITERLKDYKIYVCARDYGNYLDVQWYLTCDPGFFSKVFKMGAAIYTMGLSNLILLFDIFDQQDLIAFATSVHHSLLKAVEKLLQRLNQDPSKINGKNVYYFCRPWKWGELRKERFRDELKAKVGKVSKMIEEMHTFYGRSMSYH